MIWFFSLPDREPFEAQIPWMTYKAISYLRKILRKNMVVFEWGSGGSTRFFLKRCKKLVSIEHDENWYLKIKTVLGKNSENLIYKLAPPVKGRGFRSSAKEYNGLSFAKYCQTILEYPNSYFDFVIVDGRARNDCIRLAIRKVKNKGFLILDNSEREIYSKGIKLLKKWKRLDFEGPGPVNDYPWTTSAFQKTAA